MSTAAFDSATGATATSAPSAETLVRIRPKVREMLMRIPAFGEMQPEEQGKLAHDMVKLLSFLDDPNGLVSEAANADALQSITPANVRAFETTTANEQTRQNLSKSPGFAGKDFVAGAAVQGTDQFVRLVQNVDFPAFVGGLINNVFRSIVETSIEQMRAYAELVANVAKSASEFMNENIGMGQGRDYLVDRFPDLLDMNVEEDGRSRLTLKGDDGAAALKDIHDTMGLPGKPPESIDDEESELALVNSARLAMAKSRQQLLASMVLLGINRIVVTDGSISAKVRFDMRATDDGKRGYNAAAYDRQTNRSSTTSAFGGSFLGLFGGGSVDTNERRHMATVSTSVDESSEAKLELSAQLKGEVRVNFKSDYLPLEKMATPEMIGAIQGNATPTPPRVLPAGSAATPAISSGGGGP
jgi:hypothetical protein